MRWIAPPEEIRRFTRHQLAQHAVATALGAVLAASAAISSMLSGSVWREAHVLAGLTSAGFFLYHVAALVAIGIRHDVPTDKVAFLPARKPGTTTMDRQAAFIEEGKYSPAERGDYLGILLWTTLLVATGTILRWPGKVGVPGVGALGMLKAGHAGCGAAWVIHLFVVHIPGRWIRAASPFRRAILTGRIPLEHACRRPGWVADLVSAGILVPAPSEQETEDRRETRQVRDILEEGNRLAREERYEEAARAFDEALELFPDYSQARFNLGITRMKQGRPDLAEEQFRVFIEMDPFNAMAERARNLLKEIAGGGTGRAL
jgi:hypothetical protein